jgi:hypothetical protein
MSSTGDAPNSVERPGGSLKDNHPPGAGNPQQPAAAGAQPLPQILIGQNGENGLATIRKPTRVSKKGPKN